MKHLDPALAYARAHRAQHLAQLCELLRIPSISTLPEHAAEVQRAARWCADYLRGLGLEAVEIIPTPLHPIVLAEWLHAPDAPTVLIYGHYDVQPVDPVAQWQSPPFEPTVRGEAVFARGASDDKGLFFALLAALECYLKTEGRLPVNVKVMLEGEEEIGSPHMAAFLHQHRARLRADALLIADQPMASPELPLIEYGTRGLAEIEIEARGPRTDLHSGTFGGAVENPFNVLVRLLAALQDPATRRIRLPGFYEPVRALSDDERALINSGPATEAALLHLTGAPALAGEAGFTAAERMSVRPTLEIHGMPGGFTGEGSKTVLPGSARAKVSLRLVPDQDPHVVARSLESFLRSLAPGTVTLHFQRHGLCHPVVFDYRAPAIAAAARAYQASFSHAPAYIRGGGSLPLLYDVQQTFGADLPIVLIGFGLPDDNVHAPNEKLHLPNFYRGIEMGIHYLTELARRERVTGDA